MTPRQRKNLKRLLSPRHVAFIGGSSAALAAQQCVDAEFPGPVWGVNPKRKDMAGRPCFDSIEALPEPPDAAFVAVPREAIVETVSALARSGAGGAVCYTAGFRETGRDGAAIEQQLVDASGDLALVGPNCLGLLNYVGRAILWPYGHGGAPVDRGVAVISQSGLLCTNLTMSQRSVPFSYVVSIGNQSVIGIEDLLDALLEEPAVSAIGVYAEGLRNICAFSETSIKALKRGIPIVVLKAGRSQTGAMLTVTHTGSLAGTDQLFDVLFERLGVIRVQSPAELLETLKMLHCAGAPAGNRIAAFTCSGGDAALIADLAEARGLIFPQPKAEEAAALRKVLPPIATVSNPLDYTTPLWGKGDALEEAFTAMFTGTYDAAVIVQDYMSPRFTADNEFYLSDSQVFIRAVRRAGIPGAIVSSIPENLPDTARQLGIEGSVAPLQGMETAIAAIAGAAGFGIRRANALADGSLSRLAIPAVPPIDPGSSIVLDEWQGKRELAAAGIAIPEGRVSNADGAADTAEAVGFPVALKLLSSDLPHKTEAGGVKLGLRTAADVRSATGEIVDSVHRFDPFLCTDRFLVEEMVENPVAELLVGIRYDLLFGHVMVLGAGGALVELMKDTASLILPTDRSDVSRALRSLRISALLEGYRGARSADIERVVDSIMQIVNYAIANRTRLVELDINPLMILPDRAIAADVLLRVTSPDTGIT